MPNRRLRLRKTSDPIRRGEQYQGQPNGGMDMAHAGYQTISKHTPGEYPGERKTPDMESDRAPYPDYED